MPTQPWVFCLGFPVPLPSPALGLRPRWYHTVLAPSGLGMEGAQGWAFPSLGLLRAAVSWVLMGPELHSGHPSLQAVVRAGTGRPCECCPFILSAAGQAVQRNDRGWQGLHHNEQAFCERRPRPVSAMPG